MTTFTLDDFKAWPPGVSDGLETRCAFCDERPGFDYRVDDTLWVEVVPEAVQNRVICLSCLDAIAVQKGRELADYLREVQFVGCRSTIFLAPSVVVRRVKEAAETPGD